MPKMLARKDIGVDAVTVNCSGTGQGGWLAPMVAVNGKTTGITAADRVAPQNSDEIAYEGYARIHIEAADFAEITTRSGHKRGRNFPVANRYYADVPMGGPSGTVIAWALCDHATSPLSESCAMVVDEDFSQAFSPTSQLRASAGILYYEE